MDRYGRTVEEVLAGIAGTQRGLATWVQLRRAGVSEMEIVARVRCGQLIRIHEGVYRVGHRAPSIESDYLAAVLACGEGALLSGFAAAHLLRLIRGASPSPEVTAPTERSVPGVLTHRARRTVRAGMKWRGVPVTTVPETIVDLAGHLGPAALARACHEAGILHRLEPMHVEAVLSRRPNARGAGKLRAIYRGDVQVTLSKLEKRFLSLIKGAGLPLPITNRLAGGRFVDCRWPHQRLTVELDSYRYHYSRHAWEDDQDRER